MKLRAPILLLFFVGFGAAAFFLAPAMRFPWVGTVCLCFAGIMFFDSYGEVTKTWANTILFLLIYGLTLQAVLEAGPESFWRDYAACIFLVSLLFEQNSKTWSGLGFLRSMMTPSILFFILVMAQSIPFLRAETTMVCALLAVLVFSFLEIFSILRENNDLNSGSFMSAVRAASCGAGSLFYSATFLPGAAKDYPFVMIRLILPAIGLFVAFAGGFFKQWRRRYILFCCNWSLFVFWAAITGEPLRFFAAVAALVAGVWTIMMTNRESIDPANTKDLYLKLSAWGVPGSLMFSMIVFALYPTDNQFVSIGSVLWLITFIIYWSGLRKFEFPKKAGVVAPWKWRHNLALVLTIAGAALLAGGPVFAGYLYQIWGISH